MTLEFGSSKKFPVTDEKKRAVTPCESPRPNGSKPSVPERVAEKLKKHDKRDGRK